MLKPLAKQALVKIIRSVDVLSAEIELIVKIPNDSIEKLKNGLVNEGTQY